MTHAIVHADLLAYLRGNRWMVQNGYLPKYHAILCDPPYGLEFMGKEWDKPKPSGLMATRSARDPKHSDTSKRPYLAASVNQYVAGEDFQHWVTEWAELLIDYVYPGGLLMAFGGTRTYHRLAAGLEDAGWEIADCIMWAHGQGFPKSAAIGKLLDKEAGATREVVGRMPVGWGGLHQNGHLNDDNWNKIGTKYPEGQPITAPATPLAARWEGYGTALKPAFEPCVVARAPRDKHTYAALAREFGTGALAIDAARIGYQDDADWQGAHGGNSGSESRHVHNAGLKGRPQSMNITPAGRWPANFALVCTCESDDHAADCPVAVLGAQSGVSSSTANPRNNGEFKSVAKGYEYAHVTHGHEDQGTAARFFYTAKAAAWEREAGLLHRTRQIVNDGRTTPIDNPFQRGDTLRVNVHPTVKPIRMAEYLATLLLPPVLDTPRRLLVPFAGSGSEMIGALLAGWDEVTGIEREAEYAAIARARVGWWAQFGTYDEARRAHEKAKREPIILPAPVVSDDKPTQIALFEEASA